MPTLYSPNMFTVLGTSAVGALATHITFHITFIKRSTSVEYALAPNGSTTNNTLGHPDLSAYSAL